MYSLTIFSLFFKLIRLGKLFLRNHPGRNLEQLLRKKVEGLCVHVAATMASHTLRILLRQRFGIDVLTFEQTPVQPFGQLT